MARIRLAPPLPCSEKKTREREEIYEHVDALVCVVLGFLTHKHSGIIYVNMNYQLPFVRSGLGS